MGNAAHLESVLPVGHSLGSSLCGGAAQPLERRAPCGRLPGSLGGRPLLQHGRHSLLRGSLRSLLLLRSCPSSEAQVHESAQPHAHAQQGVATEAGAAQEPTRPCNIYLLRSAPYRTEALTELLAHAADHIALHRMHQVLLACLTHIYRPPAQAHLALSRAERKAGAALHALLAALGALVPGVALAATRACLLLLAAR